MNILISGCSFTHWPETPGSSQNICWPSYLHQHLPDVEITNLAEPGAGNQYITNSIIQEFCNDPGKEFDLVLIMWTGVSRLDFLTDISNPDWLALFEDYGFYRRVGECPNKLGYIFSGGQLGTWVNHPTSVNMFRQMYKVSSHLSLAYHNLMEIIKCQEFLRAKKVPYRFMSYVNYWNDKESVSPNGDFGVLAYPELIPMIKNIDFSNWVFLNDQRDGIYEMAKENDDYHGDRFHPGIKTHQRWAEILSRSINC